jgi:ABC-2 type transport system permease protein
MALTIEPRPAPAADLVPWDPFRQSLRSTFFLGMREVRTVLRSAGVVIPNLLVPVLFFFVIVGSLEGIAERSGLENYKAFQVPVVIMFAVTGGSAGMNLVVDIESGYFDKLLLTPANRLAILLGAMGADFVRVFVQGLFVVVCAMAAGTDIATGVPGALLLAAIASLWGLAYSAIGFAIALKTGNPQATMNTWIFQIPLVFLSTAFAPLDALSGWLKTVATYNPVTYFFRGLRSLAMVGWDASEIGVALGTACGFGAVTISVAFLALRGRVK